jgi:hypothetical protein
MGTNNLPDLASPPTKVDATTDQYNAITDALQGNQVMRDSAGVPEDNVHDIGRPSSGRPRTMYLGTGLNVAGKDIDFSAIALQETGITSGAAKTSGYPQYLQAGGGGNDYFKILATATPLEMTIDGEAYSLENDLQSADLGLAPGSNNTCLVNDTLLADQENTKTIGEWGYHIIIDTIGTEITALDGTVQVFNLNNGVDDELFIAKVDTTNNKLTPIKRGICGTSRIAFANNDTVTLLKGHHIFLDNDLATIGTTTTYPVWASAAPTSPATGDRWFDVANRTWKRYSGASWEQRGEIYLGYAVCDATDCLYVEPEDFNLGWNDSLYHGGVIGERLSGKLIIKTPLRVNVAGQDILINSDIEPASFTSGGWAYVYVDNVGALQISAIPPRKKDQKKGLYHPNEYYRLIGVYYNYGGLASAISNSDGMVELPNDSFYSSHEFKLFSGASGSAGFTTAIDDQICPIAKAVGLFYEEACDNVTSTLILSGSPQSKDKIAKQLFAIIDTSGYAGGVFSGERKTTIIEGGVFDYRYNNANSMTLWINYIEIDL